MKAINNDNLVNGLCACTCVAFAPKVDYAIGTNSVVFTQSSTFDAGDSLKRLRVDVYGKTGKVASSIMSGAGTGATAGTVTFSGGTVTGVPVAGGGTGYTVAPRVKLTGGGGTGAVAKAVVSAAGVITSVVIVNGGTGYASAPTATFVTNEAEVSLAGLDASVLQLKATLISTNGCKADLAYSNVTPLPNTSGTLGSIAKQ